MSDVSEKLCIGLCGQILPDTEEFFERNGHGQSLRKMCKRCRNQKSSQLKHLKRIRQMHSEDSESVEQMKEAALCVKDPSDYCGCCGIARGNILGDIDGSTQEIYGYLCVRCYHLVRDFREDVKRMRQVIDYLEKTRHNLK